MTTIISYPWMLVAKTLFTISLSCKLGFFNYSDCTFHENLEQHSGSEKSTGGMVLIITRPGFYFCTSGRRQFKMLFAGIDETFKKINI